MQPSCLVNIIESGTLNRLSVISRKKVKMMSSHHVPYALGDTRATIVGTKGHDPARVSQLQKSILDSDCRLQLACMKLESLVITDQSYNDEFIP